MNDSPLAVDPDLLPDRMVAEVVENSEFESDHNLANLWFRLSEPAFEPVAFVPVRPLRGDVTFFRVAKRLAMVGSAITHSPVLLVRTIGLASSNAERAEEAMNQLYDEFESVILVADAPGVNPASVPILNSCARVVLAIGMNHSKRAEIDAIVDSLASDNVIGAVCLEANRRHGFGSVKRPVKLQPVRS